MAIYKQRLFKIKESEIYECVEPFEKEETKQKKRNCSRRKAQQFHYKEQKQKLKTEEYIAQEPKRRLKNHYLI